MACSSDRYQEPLLAYHASKGTPEESAREAEAIEANLGVARRFAYHTRGMAPIEDVEAAARLGLVQAIRTWSEDGGANLSTWARGPMAAEIRKVKETSQAVRIPSKTLKAARAIRESGEDVEAACKRLGKHTGAIKAALQVRTCELTEDLGATSIEEHVFESEIEALLSEAAKCWRGDIDASRLVTVAESLMQRRGEHAAAASKHADPRKQAEHRALADGLWPRYEENRVKTLARLDYALTLATKEQGIDVECWRLHYVDGLAWTDIGTWLGNLSRTRAQFRAKRAESAIVRAIAEVSKLPDEAITLWARRPVEVIELERLGALTPESDPLTILYAVEDLEVALTEIDPGHARVWSARARGMSWSEISSAEGIARKTVRAWAARADEALRELLQAEGEIAVQLELFSDSDFEPEMLSVSWWSPLAKEAVVTITKLRARSMRSGRVHASDVMPSPRSLLIGSCDRADRLGCPASPRLATCTGPPGGARASPMLC